MLFDLARRARRRFFFNEILAQSAWAVSAALLAFILLLVLGTQILDWYWLIIIPFLTFGVGAWRTSRRLPDLYRITQVIDRRLDLADTLSTALYFSAGAPGDRVSQDVRRSQRSEAERVAATVDLERAIPFTMPRAVYAMSLLGLVATSLFALRYGMDRKLDLRPPLARIIHQALGGPEVQVAEKKNNPAQKQRLDPNDTLGMSLENEGRDPGMLDAPEASPFDTVGVKDNQQKSSGKSDAKGKTPGAEEMEGEQAAGDEADSSGQSQNGSASEGQPSSSPGKQAGKQTAESQSGSPGEQSSLMSKLKEAMSNLLSRMKQQPASSGSEQQTAQSQGKQGKQSQGGRNSRSGKNNQNSSGEQAQSEEGQSGEEAQNAQAQGQANGQSGEERASNQPGSGIGRQDGSKDVKLAEQLAAMGKISEIIGKRTANVTGDMTVEVQSGDQRLSTPYSRRNAQHSDAGGDINRDEVPVALQPYVQQYFEQIRKQEPPPASR